MFKNKNEVTKISNILFITLFGLSILSIISFIFGGTDSIEGFSKSDYYFNIVMLAIYSIASFIVLFLTNKKVDLYKDEYPLSRRIFNLFIVLLVMSMAITLSAEVFNYVFYKKFSWYSVITLIIGYVPSCLVAIKEVSKGKLLSASNEKKINVANLLIIYLLMNYYLNSVMIIFKMIFKMDEITTLIGGLCWSFIWIAVIVISYRLINKKEEFIFKSKKM